jgi:hypothetical protein
MRAINQTCCANGYYHRQTAGPAAYDVVIQSVLVQVKRIGADLSGYGVGVPRLLLVDMIAGLKTGTIESSARRHVIQPGGDHRVAVAWVEERIAERGRGVGRYRRR